jgi:hypothetical protein
MALVLAVGVNGLSISTLSSAPIVWNDGLAGQIGALDANDPADTSAALDLLKQLYDPVLDNWDANNLDDAQKAFIKMMICKYSIKRICRFEPTGSPDETVRRLWINQINQIAQQQGVSLEEAFETVKNSDPRARGKDIVCRDGSDLFQDSQVTQDASGNYIANDDTSNLGFIINQEGKAVFIGRGLDCLPGRPNLASRNPSLSGIPEFLEELGFTGEHISDEMVEELNTVEVRNPGSGDRSVINTQLFKLRALQAIMRDIQDRINDGSITTPVPKHMQGILPPVVGITAGGDDADDGAGTGTVVTGDGNGDTTTPIDDTVPLPGEPGCNAPSATDGIPCCETGLACCQKVLGVVEGMWARMYPGEPLPYNEPYPRQTTYPGTGGDYEGPAAEASAGHYPQLPGRMNPSAYTIGKAVEAPTQGSEIPMGLWGSIFAVLVVLVFVAFMINKQH